MMTGGDDRIMAILNVQKHCFVDVMQCINKCVKNVLCQDKNCCHVCGAV